MGHWPAGDRCHWFSDGHALVTADLYCLPRTRGAGASLRVQDLNGNLHSLTLPCWQGEALDWLVITTKAADTLPALQSWADYLPGVNRILPDNQTDDDLPLTVYAGAGTTLAGRWPGR